MPTQRRRLLPLYQRILKTPLQHHLPIRQPSERVVSDVDQEQPFLSHLVELRTRLLRIAAGVLIVFAVLVPFANPIYEILAEPLLAQLPEGNEMVAIDPISPFLTPMKLTLVLALFIAMPWVLYQLWAFVAPGLYHHEKRLVAPVLISSTMLFYCGMAFAFYIILPIFFAFITSTAPEGVAVMTDIGKYLDFVLTLFFAFGIAFEVPIATVILVLIGVTTPETLVAKRPYIILGAFVVGMLLTPPDVISQTLLALPMWALFEIGVFCSRIFIRRRQEAAQVNSTSLNRYHDKDL
jgi:sec-independent protein translocase protein TatC